jgi:hypothetical protein
MQGPGNVTKELLNLMLSKIVNIVNSASLSPLGVILA